MVEVGKTDVIAQDENKKGTALDQETSDAWACAMADLLWNDREVRERMSAHFQKIVDKMLEVSTGKLPKS